jgi:hypothetical protein
MVEIRRGREMVTGRPGDFPRPHRPDNGAGAKTANGVTLDFDRQAAILRARDRLKGQMKLTLSAKISTTLVEFSIVST